MLFIPSVLSYPAMRLASQPVHQRYVHPGPLVLGLAPLKYPTPMADRDRTVSRRSNPARTTLNGEQLYPWDCSAPGCDEPTSGVNTAVDMDSWAVSFVVLAYLYPLSDGPSTEPPDHYDRLSSLLDLSVSRRRAYAIAL